MRLSLKALRDLGLATLVLCAAGGVPAFAKTFVYVSNAQDGNIDAYTLDKSSGALTAIGKVPFEQHESDGGEPEQEVLVRRHAIRPVPGRNVRHQS